MKRLFYRILALVALLSAAPALATTSHKSPGGIPFLLTEIANAKKVVFRVHWPHSWPYQAGNNPAAPSVGAQLMIQGGAGGKMPLTLLQKFNELNSTGQIAATRAGMIGVLALGKDNIPAAATLVADILGAPTLDEKWLRRIKSNIRKTQAATNKKLIQQAWNAIRYADLHAQPIRGYYSGDDLGVFDRLTRQDVQRWHKQTFQKAGMIVAVAGPITAQEAGQAIDLMAAKLPQGKKPRPQKVKIYKHPNRIWLHVPHAKKALIGYSASIPPNSKGHEVEDLITLNLLRGNDKSGLLQALRTEMRATYSVFATQTVYGQQTKFFSFGMEVKPDDVAKVDQITRAHYKKFRNGALNVDFFAALRNNLAKTIAGNSKKPGIAAFMALANRLDGFDVKRIDHIVGLINATTLSSVKKHLKRDFPAEADLQQIVVSPDLPKTDGYCVITNPSQAAGC